LTPISHRLQLVCQQLENIDRIALEKYQHLIRKYIRGLLHPSSPD
jgi:hypothetical protein